MTNCIKIKTKRFTLKGLKDYDKKQLIKVLNDYGVPDMLTNVLYPYKINCPKY
jgi:hypothetical protein